MKRTISMSINDQIAKQFNKVTDEKLINKSKLVEKLIIDWLKENDKK